MRLLVVEDDAALGERLRTRLVAENYAVDLARDGIDGAHLGATEPYDALILDQMLPFDPSADTDRYWGGCLLLRWLRGAPSPEKAPVTEARQKDVLGRLRPRVENRELPAMVVSAFYDDQVVEATRNASERDHAIPFLDKPVDVDEVRRLLEQVPPR